MTYLLASGLIAACAAVVTFALLGRRDATSIRIAGDLLNEERGISRQYKSERDIEVAAHAVTRKRLEQEQNLRAIAEAQRNEAQRKVRDMLTKHMRNATDDEIRALTADAFSSPLSLVPKVPEADDATPDDLLDPFARVPTP